MPSPLRALRIAVLCSLLGVVVRSAAGQLRVVTWNVSNYSGGRIAEFQSSIYGEFEGRSMRPDVFIGQEFINTSGVNAFLGLLNTAPGSPGDWQAAPFINGPDTDSAFFYRTSKVDFLGVTVVAVGGFSPNHPRNLQRYDIRLKEYAADAAVLACYSTHMKASTGGSNEARRLLEAQRMRDDAESLPADWQFLVGGDFNIRTSFEGAYQEMVGAQANNDGRFADPIKTPGNWNNTSFFRIVHTQDPTGAGGMDDRFDQVLVSHGLIDGEGFDYIGDPDIPYSTLTWDDPNHSYRSWVNDGTAFHTSLAVATHQMAGPVIAQALRNAVTSSGGHLPVFLDLAVPPKVDADEVLDFGEVEQGAAAVQSLVVNNAGDVALWTAGGIADLEYDLAADPGFTAPAGPFIESAGGGGNMHAIEMDTSAPGERSGTLTIHSNDVDQPERTVMLVGRVVVPCVGDPCDADCSGTADLDDIDAFLGQLLNDDGACSDCAADANRDGARDGRDVEAFVECLISGG